MMKKKYILYMGAALLLAGCADENSFSADNGTLSGDGKTPLVIDATLDTGTAVTRAEGKKFETGDVLLAYLRHTTGGSKGSYTTANPADQAPRLVTFTMTADAEAATGTVTETSAFNVSYTGTGSIGTVTKLYWDDFSQSTADGSKDLRTSGHGLQSYYGYCYNGGTPTTALVETTGVLGWTVPADQTVESGTPLKATNLQHSDLLWSAEQESVSYDHSTNRETGDHVMVNSNSQQSMTIPYTHAMSQVTVTVTAADGFTGDPLTATTLTLESMNTRTTLTAPAGTFFPTVATAETDAAEEKPSLITSVKMHADTYTGGLTRKYTAIVAPGTKLKEGAKLLDIKDVDDNDYTVTITASMLATTAWGDSQNNTVTVVSGSEGTGTQSDPSRAYLVTQPGVNYHLTVTIKKTEIQTRATLADWQTVNATGTGDIDFPNDDPDLEMLDDDDAGITGMTDVVKVVAVDRNLFKAASSFTLFMLRSTGDNTGDGKGKNTRPNDTDATHTGYNFATISTFTKDMTANDQWTNNPEIYWPNKTYKYYFRALAQYNGIDGTVNDISDKGSDKSAATIVRQGTIAEGRDIIWGTTAKHIGKTKNITYQRGQAIPPRTGDVPIAFDHAMSKVTFILETSGAEDDTATPSYAPVNDNNSKVDLRKASIAISNLSTSGTITLDDGDVTPEIVSADGIPTITATSQNLVKRLTVIDQYIVIPQNIGNDAVITITLKDQSNNVTATYKLNLNECVVSGSTTPITRWQRGQHYIYTIHIEKEQITFRALIKEWEEKQGSGNANLEWD